MFVTWENTYDGAIADTGNGVGVDASTTLDFTIQMNFHSMILLGTNVDQAVDVAASSMPFLNYYLTFLNPNEDTVTSLGYDAFSGLIQFKSTATDDVDDNTKDSIRWYPNTNGSSGVTDTVDPVYG